MDGSSKQVVQTKAQSPPPPRAQPSPPPIKLATHETIDTCNPKDSESQTSPQIMYKSHKKAMDLRGIYMFFLCMLLWAVTTVMPWSRSDGAQRRRSLY